MGLLQVWQGKLHVPGMFRAHIVADMLAGSGDIGSMLTGSEVILPPISYMVLRQILHWFDILFQCYGSIA